MPATATSPASNPTTAPAHEAGLRYVHDGQAGIRRVRRGQGWAYLRADRSAVSDAEELARIRAIAIPPAWTDVWICPSPQGHIQATGRDSRGRKQYRYHPRWREARDATKFTRMQAFGQALPKIRRRVTEDLRGSQLTRDLVLAAVVRLLDEGAFRVGNGEYARTNGSFGLSTLRDRHVRVHSASLRFTFTGKGGKETCVDIQDRRLARVVGRCRDLPGQDLFQYLDDEGNRHTVGSEDVNAYLRAIGGEDFSAKDFRTWRGTVIASAALRCSGVSPTRAAATRAINAALRDVSSTLGNTPAVCRKAYVHPGVLEAYLDGRVADSAPASKWLTADERATLRFLRALEPPARSRSRGTH